MSYEKKIKELMARLAAMSPEPPPYPEEMSLARRQEPRKASPVLVFTAAVALVAVLAIPLLLFTGGEDPILVGSTTTTTSPTTTTVPIETTTSVGTTTTTGSPSTTTTTAPVTAPWSGVVYLYQTPEDSLSSNPALVPLIIEVDGRFDEDSEFTQALAVVGETLPEGFSNAIPTDVTVVSRSSQGDLITVDMSESFLVGAGGLLADYTMLNQLIYTLTYGDPEAVVLFTVAGEPVEVFGSEGLDLTEPVGRDSFLDHLHVINLTVPVLGVEDGYQVVGIANVFEATVSIAVLDASGEEVHEEFVTATCGTGCWGEFGTAIAAEHVIPGESTIRVFTHSAEDGSVTNSLTIPVVVDGIWQLTAEG